MILLYGSQEDYDAMAGKPSNRPAMSQDEVAAMHAHMVKVNDALVESGEHVFAGGLTAPAQARRVRLRTGSAVVTDGPYPESQEVLAGFNVVECDSIERATEIAARFVDPTTEGAYVDIRPMVDGFEDLET
ncbi:MAG TPA: YciI family protein [Actinopolymorphaceae bacterium]